MRAARVQQLRNLLLVSHAIELCLNRIRRGSHLTERESGGEHFDEDRFHHSSEESAASWLHALRLKISVVCRDISCNLAIANARFPDLREHRC